MRRAVGLFRQPDTTAEKGGQAKRASLQSAVSLFLLAFPKRRAPTSLSPRSVARVVLFC